MRRVVIEEREDPRIRPTLDALAGAAAVLGHEVVRWVHADPLPPADVAILWNGLHPCYVPARVAAEVNHTRLLYAELAWLPQDGPWQLDPVGVNAEASWADAPLPWAPEAALPTGPGKHLLVILQSPGDQQIERLSPHFCGDRAMVEFVEFLLAHSRLPLRVRAHPLFAPDERIDDLLRDAPRADWDHHERLADSLDDCAAVATINSTAGLEALDAGLPVLCYGRAIYRHAPAVHCLDGQAIGTARVMADLADGRTGLDRGAVRAILARVRRRQWRTKDLPRRLAPLLEGRGDPCA